MHGHVETQPLLKKKIQKQKVRVLVYLFTKVAILVCLRLLHVESQPLLEQKKYKKIFVNLFNKVAILVCLRFLHVETQPLLESQCAVVYLIY